MKLAVWIVLAIAVCFIIYMLFFKNNGNADKVPMVTMNPRSSSVASGKVSVAQKSSASSIAS